MLPVSTLVNNYCKQYQPCENDKPVMDIVNSLLKHIEPGCAVHSSNRANVLQALRALGNIGHVLTITRSVSQCFVMTMNPAEVKVAALQAYRRLPCTADVSMSVFKSTPLTVGSHKSVASCGWPQVAKHRPDIQYCSMKQECTQSGQAKCMGIQHRYSLIMYNEL